MASRSITDISVEGVQKRKLQSNCKQIVFAVKVTWSDGTVNVIYRTYRNFSELEEKLVQAFNDEEKSKNKKSRVIPKLEGKDRIRSDEQKKWGWIDNFCMALLDLPTIISESEIMEDFFTPTSDDLTSNKRRKEEGKNTKAKKKKEKRIKKQFNSIKVIGSPFRGEEYQVLEDYKRQTDREISLKEGKIVTVVLKREDGWWLIKAEDENGWAPASYLIPVNGEDGENDSREAAPGEGEMYQSLKAYKAKEDDELSFPAGVTLQIVKKNLDGWWTALYMGRKGSVPAIYLKKLGNKKKHRARFSIKRLTLRSRKSNSTRLAKAREKWQDKVMEDLDSKGSEQKKRAVTKISFADELDIPPRSEMSVKRKISGIHDPNENKEMVFSNESGVNSKPAEPNEKDYKDNESEATGDEQTDSTQDTKLMPLRRKKSQSFSYTMEKDVPRIQVTSPAMNRSLSLGSADKTHGISSPTTSYEVFPVLQRFDAQIPCKNSNTPGEGNVFDGSRQRKQSSSNSETSIENLNSSLDRRRRKGTPGNLKTYDTPQTLEKQNLLQQKSGQLQSNEQKYSQIPPREEQKTKESKTLPRGLGLQQSNLLEAKENRLSSSTPDLSQINTTKQTDWQPQQFDNLHPKFQKKAIKIASKTYETMINESRNNEKTASETELSKLGNHFDQPDGLHGDNSSSEGKRNVRKSGFRKRSPLKERGQTKDNASSSYSDVDLESNSSNRSRSPSPFPRPGSSASVSSTSCSSSSGSLSELEFNSYNYLESRERHQLSLESSINNEHGLETFDQPPTYSLPDCPELYKAVCGYEAENSRELSFLRGELLEVIKQADNGWWLARSGSKKGWVPSNYLQLV